MRASLAFVLLFAAAAATAECLFPAGDPRCQTARGPDTGVQDCKLKGTCPNAGTGNGSAPEGGSGGNGISGALSQRTSNVLNNLQKPGLRIPVPKQPGSGNGEQPTGRGGGAGGGAPSVSGAPAGESAISRAEAERLLQGHNIQDMPAPKTPLASPKAPPPDEAAKPAAEPAPNLGAKVLVSEQRAAPGGGAVAASPQALADEMKRRMDAGDAQGALEEASALVKAVPDDPAPLKAEAALLTQLGRDAEAEQDLLRAVALEPRDPAVWSRLSQVELKRGRYQDALNSALKALELDPNNAAAWALKAYALEMLGRHDEAMEALALAARLDKRFAPRLEEAKASGKISLPADDLAGELAGGGRGRGLPPWAPYAGGAAALGMLVFTLLAVSLARRGAPQVVVVTAPAASAPAPAPAAAAAPPAPSPSSAATVVDLQPGALVGGKYRLVRPLGRGGMGEVFEGLDEALQRPVAVKTMAAALDPLGPRGREMFVREARTVAALKHAAIVDIYDIVDESGRVYLIFELVKGRTAAQLLEERKSLSVAEAKALLLPVCEALAYAHGRGLVHRDLKPANVMITDDGRVKLMDFGIARSLGDTALAAGGAAARAKTVTVIGTPAYMAPEARFGALRAESDVYALGACLFELLSGAPPSSDAVRLSHAAPGCPPALDELAAAALQPDPDKRLKTAAEFAARLSSAG